MRVRVMLALLVLVVLLVVLLVLLAALFLYPPLHPHRFTPLALL